MNQLERNQAAELVRRARGLVQGARDLVADAGTVAAMNSEVGSLGALARSIDALTPETWSCPHCKETTADVDALAEHMSGCAAVR